MPGCPGTHREGGGTLQKKTECSPNISSSQWVEPDLEQNEGVEEMSLPYQP